MIMSDLFLKKRGKLIFFDILRLIGKVACVIIITFIIILVIRVITGCSIGGKLTIYNGPYSTYTPVSLQTKRQKEINEKVSLCKCILGKDVLIKIEVTKDQNLTYSEGWWQSLERNKPTQLKKFVLFTNSYFWLLLNNGHLLNTTWRKKPQEDAYRLEVIGYKKTEKPYYTSRFIWHKDMLFPNLEEPDSCLSFLLNSKSESGSTHIVPEVYLLENSKESLPDISWDTRQNIIQECVYKKQIIGVTSHSEYNEQLDKAMKDSLSIKDIMVNIPTDVVVMVTGYIPKTSISDRPEELDSLLVMDDKTLKEKYNACLWTGTNSVKNTLQAKNLIITRDKDSVDYAKAVCLHEMFKYYVSMGILRPNEKKKKSIILPQESDWLKVMSTRESDSILIYKTRYGNLEDHYYSFDFICKIPKNKLNEYIDSTGNNKRVIPCGPFADELNNLINKRNSLFKRQRYDSN